jgi:ABC-type sugar transport system substrate-binding protein
MGSHFAALPVARAMPMNLPAAPAAVLAAALVTACATTPPARPDAMPGEPLIGLITKTASNPYFVQMLEGARSAARRHGAQLLIAGPE